MQQPGDTALQKHQPARGEKLAQLEACVYVASPCQGLVYWDMHGSLAYESAVLCCAVLCCAVLCCAVLSCANGKSAERKASSLCIWTLYGLYVPFVALSFRQSQFAHLAQALCEWHMGA